MGKLKVEGHSNLYRDSSSGSIYNSDRNGLMAAKRRKKELMAEKERIETLENDVKEIKSSIDAILELLKKDKK